jgi:hypothetical protein
LIPVVERLFPVFYISPPQDLEGGDEGEGAKALNEKAYPLTFILSHKGRRI